MKHEKISSLDIMSTENDHDIDISNGKRICDNEIKKSSYFLLKRIDITSIF